MSEGTNDRAIMFGAEESLIGIVTQPALTPSGERPAIVILNTGIAYRIGHNRMYVALARTLAEAGHTVLRFDMSGIGDSDNRNDGLAPLEANLADIRDAIDWLALPLRVRRVILVGLCSGADHATLFSGSDCRVAGVVLIDPNFPIYGPRYFGRRVLRWRTWTNFFKGEGLFWSFLRRKVVRTIEITGEDEGGITGEDQWQNPITCSQLLHAFQESAKVGIHMLAICTGGNWDQYKALINLVKRKGNERLIRLEYFDRCDHTFTFEADRTRLSDVMMEWIRETGF
jgi:pimeloyl-ACP methyl ester carboxylesterase